MADPNDRMTQFERALDPNVAKFTAKAEKDVQSIEALVSRIRATVKTVTELCDDLDKAITESEKHARDAADSLMEMVKRVR